jgi:hypothetical protein
LAGLESGYEKQEDRAVRPGPEGDSHDMSAGSPPQRARHVISWGQARPGIMVTCVGAVLGLTTVVFSATNTISAQQAIAMAVPAIVSITGGLIHTLVLDSWTAWRRGFEQGCQAALVYRPHGLNTDGSTTSDLNGVADSGRLARRLTSLRSPPDATG